MFSRSVVISVLVHVAVLAAAVIAPITASDALPAIQSPIRPYLRAFRTADLVLPSPPAQVRPVHRPASVPIVAPYGIAPERPTAPSSDGIEVPFAIEGLPNTGVPEGFDTGGISAFPPPPPPPTPTKVTAPIPVGGRIKAPTRIAYAPPAYPSMALAARVEGDVTIEAIIGVDGSVQNVRLLRGSPLLNDAALDAVSHWQYTPTLLNGVPVPVVMTVRVSFRLR
jgi:protein TonB